MTLADRLTGRIIGQEPAIQAVCEAIRRGRTGLSSSQRPWGVFLFVGPPGVGKTELAKVLSEEVYGNIEGMIRFDMGDFTEPHSTAKLVGAPPGYVGHDQGSPLVERLRRRPYSLLLFDEIEKAHPDVLAVLLRLFSDGAIEAADGALADARNAIVILTSNVLGAAGEAGRPGFGFAARSGGPPPTQALLRSTLEGLLPLSVIDRLDAIIPFNALGAVDLERIARRRIEEVAQRAAALCGVEVEVAPEVAPWIVTQSQSDSQGARGIQRTVDTQVGTPVAGFLNQRSEGVRKIRISMINDTVDVHAVNAGA
jgi:ATP-dependent Clp protease ATP-binding subunit ClpC